MARREEASTDVRRHIITTRPHMQPFLLYRWLMCTKHIVHSPTLSFFPSRRSLRWATPPRPPSSATTPATTSSPAWCPRTPTRPRPWWTSSKPCAGTTSPPWLLRGTTGRVASMRSFRSLGRTVSFSTGVQPSIPGFICTDLKVVLATVRKSHFVNHWQGSSATGRATGTLKYVFF